MLRFILVLAAIAFCLLSSDVNAQFTVQSGLTFGKAVKFEQTQGSVKKADVNQGPLLKSNGPNLPESEIYKRALIYQRITGSDTLDAVYVGESSTKLTDASHVSDGKFVWHPADKAGLTSTRDSLLRSLDGGPREFSTTKFKAKQAVVRYTYVWSDPSGVPSVTINYGEKKRKPMYLKMQIVYNAVK